jgi:crotonobetainyl-CoA:carnitine CoA-transferase CaiB-like acyl-CoA transferase
MDRDALVALFTGHNIPCAPVNSVKQALEDEQSLALGMVQTVHGHAALGSYQAVRNPVRVNMQTAPILRPAPTSGQHTVEILKTLTKLSDGEIESCFADGVVE